MPMTFAVDSDRQRCTIRLTGTVALEDLKAGVRHQVAAGAWTWDTVIDTAAATGIETDSPNVTRMTDAIGQEVRPQALPRGPVVIVVSDHRSKIYEIARLYQVMAMTSLGWRVEVVQGLADVDDALARLVKNRPSKLPTLDQ